NRSSGNDRNRTLPVPDARLQIHAPGWHEPHRPVARDSPPQEGGQVRVPLRAAGATEHGRVQSDSVAADRGDFAPAGCARVAGLDAVQALEDAEQVVPRVEVPASGNRVVLGAYGRADPRIA